MTCEICEIWRLEEDVEIKLSHGFVVCVHFNLFSFFMSCDKTYYAWTHEQAHEHSFGNLDIWKELLEG